MKNIIYDTVIVKQTVIDTVHRAIPDSSVAIEALLKSQELYNTSFVNIQNSFSYFLIAVGTFVSALAFLNFISVKGSKRELKSQREDFKKDKDDILKEIDEYIAEFEEKVENLEEKSKEDKDDILKEIDEYIAEFEEKVENLEEKSKEDKDDILKEIGYYYYKSALDDICRNNISEHFDKLSDYYNLYTIYEIELDEIDLTKFKLLDSYIEHYKEEHFSDAVYFLSSFSKFIKYCKETKKEQHFREANKIWKKLCNKFGGEENVLKAIKETEI